MFYTLVHADCKNAILRKNSGERKDVERLIMLYYSSCFPSFAFLLLVIGRICYPSDLLEKFLLLFLPAP